MRNNQPLEKVTLKEIKSHYREKLEALYNEREADRLFFIFLEEYAGLTFTAYHSRPGEGLSDEIEKKIIGALDQLAEGKPFQHILQYVHFLELKLKVSATALVPRPETEELAQLIRERTGKRNGLKILDIGTGTGCLALACARYFPEAKVTALDISPQALELAKQNADLNQLKVELYQKDFLENKNWPEGKWDLIISNPPYIARYESSSMDDVVLRNDPGLALFVEDNDPLIFYRKINEFAQKHLAENGQVFVEINERLGEETKAVYQAGGFLTELVKDMSGKDRFVIAGK